MLKRKKKPKKYEDTDWTELEKGDIIRVVSHNSYMEINGEKVKFGVPRGEYSVKSLGKDGIHVYQGMNHSYVYMGEEKRTLLGVSVSHKIKKKV